MESLAVPHVLRQHLAHHNVEGPRHREIPRHDVCHDLVVRPRGLGQFGLRDVQYRVVQPMGLDEFPIKQWIGSAADVADASEVPGRYERLDIRLEALPCLLGPAIGDHADGMVIAVGGSVSTGCDALRRASEYSSRFGSEHSSWTRCQKEDSGLKLR